LSAVVLALMQALTLALAGGHAWGALLALPALPLPLLAEAPAPLGWVGAGFVLAAAATARATPRTAAARRLAAARVAQPRSGWTARCLPACLPT
jgi:hypothetical protein